MIYFMQNTRKFGCSRLLDLDLSWQDQTYPFWEFLRSKLKFKMSAFQPNKFHHVWRYIQKDIAVLILVIGSSRKSESLSISLIFLSHSLSPQSWAARLFSPGQHVGGSIRAWSALHFIQDNNSSTKLDHVPTKTWTAAPAALGHAWQHLDQLLDSTTPNGCSTSTPDSNLQYFAAPAAPMDSSSARLAGAPFFHACLSQAAGQQHLKGLGVKI